MAATIRRTNANVGDKTARLCLALLLFLLPYCQALSSSTTSSIPQGQTPNSKTGTRNVGFEDWIADQPQQVREWKELTNVDGRIPEYVKGTWIRNGGGIWSSSEDDAFSHVFDGMAKISAYRFKKSNDNQNDGDGDLQVYHQARFLEGSWYQKFIKGQKLPPSIGTGPILDKTEQPKLGFKTTLEAIWNVVTAFDNTPVNIWDYDPLNRKQDNDSQKNHKKVVALTDAPPRTNLDFSSMETIGSTTINQFAKNQKGYELLTTAHPIYSLDTDDTYNIAVELGLSGVNVNLIRESAMGDRTVVGAFEVPDGTPYFHSFGLSRNYAVIVVQPLRLNMDIPELLEKGFLRSMQHVDYTRIVVMDIHDGDILIDQKTDEPIYFYHGISTSESKDKNGNVKVSFRICAYHTPDQLTGEHQFLRLEQARRGREWRNKIDRGGRFCDVLCDIDQQSVEVEWNHVANQGFELPITRYSRAHGGDQNMTVKHNLDAPIDDHPRYVYSFGAYALGSDDYDSWGLFKFDTQLWQVAGYFQNDSVYLSEPAFVADPSGANEDDGVLLCQAFFGVDQETKLLVLNARTMELLATVNTEMRTPMDFHGAWIPHDE